MALDSGVADLHTHTHGSDGTDTLLERIDQAKARGLDAIAITDHDRILAELGPGSTREQGLDVITGVEIRADVFDTKVEILGYYVDPENPALEAVLEQAREYRRERNQQLVAAVTDATQLELDYETLREEVNGGLGRPHIASLLVEAGLVSSVGEAFEAYLAEGGACYVQMERVPATEVLDAIHAASGVASLAHPGRIRSDAVPEIVAELADAGLDAIETWYPYGESAAFTVQDAKRLAARHDLLMTGGSDCHGADSSKFRIGDVRVSQDVLEELATAAT
jgi:predicted metal-dependent phosphoesterase TrpH